MSTTSQSGGSPASCSNQVGLAPITEATELDRMGDDDPLAKELANVDALLEQSQRLLEKISDRGGPAAGRNWLSVISSFELPIGTKRTA